MNIDNINEANATLFILSSVDKIYIVSFDKEGMIKLSNGGIAEGLRLLSEDHALWTHHRPGTGPHLYIIPEKNLKDFMKMMDFIENKHKENERKIVPPPGNIIIQ